MKSAVEAGGNGLLEQVFRLGVDGGGSLVEHENGGVAVEGADKGQKLLFAQTEIERTLADTGLKPLGQAADKAVQTGAARISARRRSSVC